MNKAVLNAITSELKEKINNLSKEFIWEDRFSFIKTINCPLDEYKDIISSIEEKIYIPFKKHEKQDILGNAYKIFLKRAGSVDNKNIILTPDHIKQLMVQLARLNLTDVVLDTCTGSGGFLMEAMEQLITLAEGDPATIKKIQDNQLIGFEIDSVLFALACSNMFLHGDGRTNMLFRTSLLNMDVVNSEYESFLKKELTVDDVSADTLLFNHIKQLKPTKVIINPPYERNQSIKFTEQAIDYLEPNGKLIIIMPTPTLRMNLELTEKILKKAKLDFVIKMPKNLFSEQKRRVNSSIFGFTKMPHHPDDKVLFYNLEDDGHKSIQHKGRVDDGSWEIKKSALINAINNPEESTDLFKRLKIFDGNSLVINGVRKNDKSEDWVKFSTLFKHVDGSLQSEKNNSDGKYDFITGSDTWKKHDTYVHDEEAIVYIVKSDGSSGKAQYVNGKFTASSLSIVLTPKNTEKYPIDLKFYTYYLNSIRKTLVSDLEDGTSKLTINPKILDEYLIKYIPYEKQLEARKNIEIYEEKLLAVNKLSKILLSNISEM